MTARPTILVMATKEYESRSARDAQKMGYGDRGYWEYLDQHARELRDHFLQHGDPVRAAEIMTRTLSEALAGNDGP